MSQSANALARLVEELEAQGAGAERIQLARCTLNFRRSWLDLAQVLVHVRSTRAYAQWGYTEFPDYCQRELGLSAGLVDKLTVSFHTLNKYAPAKLEQHTEETPMPSYQVLDYFSRAVGEPRSDGKPARDAPKEAPAPEVVDQLRSAVFEEGQSLRKLRDKFEPILRPKAPVEQQLMAVRRARLTAQRLISYLSEIDGLSGVTVPGVEKMLHDLQQEMDSLTEQLEQQQSRQEAS